MKTHESMVIEPTLFGDVLGAHGDYTTGLFYGCRRKFLSEEAEKLRPPSQFMTVKQKRNEVRQQRSGVQFTGLTKLEFTKKGPSTESEGDTHATDPHNYLKKAPIIKKAESTITIEKYPSINPAEWEKVKQAGCTFYVHKPTGEVSPEKPWVAVRSPGFSPTRSVASFSERSFGEDSFEGDDFEYVDDDDEEETKIEEEQWGCGSLAYDGTELNDLLKHLGDVPWDDGSS